jgi:hypothetical protein
VNEVWHARSGIAARGCARGRVRSGRPGSARRGVAAAGSAARPAPPARRIYPLACLIAIAVCAFTAAGNDRFTAVGQWIRQARQADLARLRSSRSGPPDPHAIRMILTGRSPGIDTGTPGKNGSGGATGARTHRWRPGRKPKPPGTGPRQCRRPAELERPGSGSCRAQASQGLANVDLNCAWLIPVSVEAGERSLTCPGHWVDTQSAIFSNQHDEERACA